MGQGPVQPGIMGQPRAGVSSVDETPYYNGPYRELIVPDDRIYFAGDHCSHIIGWQEGAALAAQRAIMMLVQRVGEAGM